jgi:hypothetical protein
MFTKGKEEANMNKRRGIENAYVLLCCLLTIEDHLDLMPIYVINTWTHRVLSILGFFLFLLSLLALSEIAVVQRLQRVFSALKPKRSKHASRDLRIGRVKPLSISRMFRIGDIGI